MIEIDIISQVTQVEVEVTVATVGPPGPAGPPGVPGGPGFTFIHTQASPSNQWIANHNIGRLVNTYVTDLGGNEVEAEVQSVSINQVRVSFVAPATGYALCQ